MDAVDELCEATGEIDGTAIGVVEGKDAGHQSLVFLRHRHADKHAVEARLPCVQHQPVELERCAVGAVEPPADAGVDDPLLEAGEVVVVEIEPATHRVAPGEVEHLVAVTRASASTSKAERAPRTGFVWRNDRSASRTRRSVRLARVVTVVVRDGAEGCMDEWCERLDVGTHHNDVAGLERRVIGQEVEDRVAHHLDLPGSAVASVDLEAAVVRVERRVRDRRWVVTHRLLDPLQQRRRGGLVERSSFVERTFVTRLCDDDLHLVRIATP